MADSARYWPKSREIIINPLVKTDHQSGAAAHPSLSSPATHGGDSQGRSIALERSAHFRSIVGFNHVTQT